MQILFILSILLVIGCKVDNKRANEILNNVKLTFGKETNKSNFLDQFPQQIKNVNIFFEINPPSCPPSVNCSKQYADIFLVVNKSEYNEELTELLNGKKILETKYSDDNIIINLTELRRNIFSINKCNNWYSNKLPIPYFEKYDFGLGFIKERKEINQKVHFNYIHNIPPDLKVFVIEAEAGNFWKTNCNEKRPLSLKEWQNGYSKGFAISEKEDFLIFWTMIW